MSTITDALEAEVAAIRAIHARDCKRNRAAVDRHFARALRLIAPRVRHFTRAYGLVDMAEDAAQACAIGLHRAILAYDPGRARFTTFVNWQLRGELSALRQRMHPETRAAARAAGTNFTSLDAMTDESEPWLLEDHAALEATEALAAHTMARRACGSLLDDYFGHLRGLALRQAVRRASPRELERIDARLALERSIVGAHLLSDEDQPECRSLSAEQKRQIARRAVRTIAARALGNPRFDPADECSQLLERSGTASGPSSGMNGKPSCPPIRSATPA